MFKKNKDIGELNSLMIDESDITPNFTNNAKQMVSNLEVRDSLDF